MESDNKSSTPSIRFDKSKGINYQDYNPNYTNKYDETESNRLNLKNRVFKDLFQGIIYSAPIDDILNNDAKVLDAGVGEGSWIFEMSRQFNNVEFIGTDIVPIPGLEDKPKNVKFVQCDTLKGLPFEDNSFDFVHQKFLNGAFLVKDWPPALKELTRVIKPGGFLEIEEGEYVFDDCGPTFKTWLKTVNNKFNTQGKEFLTINSQLSEYLNSIGQLKVHQVVRYLKFGSSNGELGKLGLQWLNETLKISEQIVCEQMNITHAEFQNLTNKIIEEIENDYKDTKYAMYRHIAQKI